MVTIGGIVLLKQPSEYVPFSFCSWMVVGRGFNDEFVWSIGVELFYVARVDVCWGAMWTEHCNRVVYVLCEVWTIFDYWRYDVVGNVAAVCGD